MLRKNERLTKLRLHVDCKALNPNSKAACRRHCEVVACSFYWNISIIKYNTVS